jgi:cell division septation protein DedD
VRPQSNNQPNHNAPQRPQQQPSPVPTIPPSSGNYVVQVASHKTQEEAQAAWNTLRQQYASIYQNRNADIRKVDLGDRGTFYRAMVGPMGRDQANALCQNLKTAGAGCIVQTR